MPPYVEPSESSTPHNIKNKSQKFSEGKQAHVWMEASKTNPNQVGMDTTTLSHHPYILSSRCAGNHIIESGKLEEAMLLTVIKRHVYKLKWLLWLLSCVFLMNTPKVPYKVVIPKSWISTIYKKYVTLRTQQSSLKPDSTHPIICSSYRLSLLLP